MATRLTLFFEPLDVLLFRDYRPFDAGLAVLGQSVMPLPTVFLGCVRGALFRQLGADFGQKRGYGLQEPWSTLLGDAEAPGDLCLRGPLLAKLDAATGAIEPLLPAARDLMISEGRPKTIYLARRMTLDDGADSGLPRAQRWRDGESAERPAAGSSTVVPWHAGERSKATLDLVTIAGARRYLAAAPGEPIAFEPGEIVPLCCVLDHESRFGMTQSPDTRAVEPELFYLKRPYRLAPGVGFAVEADVSEEAAGEVRKLDGRAVPLGGRGHHARIRVLEQALLPGDLDAHTNSPCVGDARLWLLTPALVGEKAGAAWPAGIVAAATDRPLPAGGFDMAAGVPRPLRPALPAGSVLFLAAGTVPRQAIEALGTDKDDLRAGFGLAVIKQDRRENP